MYDAKTALTYSGCSALTESEDDVLQGASVLERETQSATPGKDAKVRLTLHTEGAENVALGLEFGYGGWVDSAGH